MQARWWITLGAVTLLVACSDGEGGDDSGNGGQAGHDGNTGADSNGGSPRTGGTGTEGGASNTEEPGEGGAGGTASCELAASTKGPAYEGDLVVNTTDALEAAQQYSSITGDLFVSALEDVELPRLTHVGGDVGSLVTKHLRLPSLREVGGSVYYYLDHDLVTLDVRRLERVGGRFYVHRNSSLRELQVDNLREAGKEVEISANPELPDCFLDVVATRFGFVHTTSPECTCTRACGFVEADCAAP